MCAIFYMYRYLLKKENVQYEKNLLNSHFFICNKVSNICICNMPCTNSKGLFDTQMLSINSIEMTMFIFLFATAEA